MTTVAQILSSKAIARVLESMRHPGLTLADVFPDEFKRMQPALEEEPEPTVKQRQRGDDGFYEAYYAGVEAHYDEEGHWSDSEYIGTDLEEAFNEGMGNAAMEE